MSLLIHWWGFQHDTSLNFPFHLDRNKWTGFFLETIQNERHTDSNIFGNHWKTCFLILICQFAFNMMWFYFRKIILTYPRRMVIFINFFILLLPFLYWCGGRALTITLFTFEITKYYDSNKDRPKHSISTMLSINIFDRCQLINVSRWKILTHFTSPPRHSDRVAMSEWNPITCIVIIISYRWRWMKVIWVIGVP